MAGEERSVKVKIDNVRRVFNTRNGEMIALNGVSLDIMENEFICVVGPSGCGKSTLLNIIAGLLEPTSGKVYCDGKEVTGTIDEIKDFMFVVTDKNGTSYGFTFEEKPEGLENVSNGDTVTVKYTGTVSEVDPFEGEVISVEKTK